MTPVFSKEVVTHTADILDILLNIQDIDPAKICGKVPYQPEQECTFIVDTSTASIKHRDDVKSDGNGMYIATGVHKQYFDSDYKKMKTESNAKYLVKSSYYTHGNTKTFCRRYHELFVRDNGIFGASAHILLTYQFKNNKPCTILREPHGNSSGRRQYERARKSTLLGIQERSKEGMSASDTYRSLMRSAGDFMTVENTANMPRSMQQIYDLRRSKDEEMIVDLIERSKQPNSEVIFVCEVPYLVIVLAQEWQLQLMEMCMTNHPSVIGIDVTYNCTQFYVTPLCLGHPLVVNRKGKRPYMVGPTCISNSQSREVFTLFANALILKNRGLRDGRLILGSDNQKGLVDGFSEPFRNVHHIACFRHLENNIRDKLTGCSSERKREFLDDILYGPKALANATAEEFPEHLEKLESRWEAMHKGFHMWFKTYQVDRFVKSVIREAREAAGLQEGEIYYNNSSEAINKILKKGMTAKTTVKTFIEHYGKEVQKVLSNIERSIVDEGPYSIRAQYRKELEVGKHCWRTMSLQQRLRAKKKLIRGSTKKLQRKSQQNGPSRSDVIVIPKRKSRKPGERIRLRQTSRCTASCHRGSQFYHLVRSISIRKGQECEKCNKIIKCVSKGCDSLLAAGYVFKSHMVNGRSEVKCVRSLVHLRCLRRSALYNRTLHMCPEFENLISEEQNDMLI